MSDILPLEPTPAAQMIFRVSGDGRLAGQVVPAFPFDAAGAPLVPEGRVPLTLAQAATLSGSDEADLAARFRVAFPALLDDELFVSELGADRVVAGGGTEATVDGGEGVGDVDTFARRVVRLNGDLFRAMFYPHFSDAHFAFFMDECQRRGFNPRAREIFAELRFNEVREELEVIIIIGIAGLRRIAIDSGAYGGCEKQPVFIYEKPGDSYPAVCEFEIIRMHGATPRPIVGRARWREFNPDGGVPKSLYRAEKPEAWLWKIAEADAIRRGFPERAAGLYLSEELTAMRRAGDGARDRRERRRSQLGDDVAVVTPASLRASGEPSRLPMDGGGQQFVDAGEPTVEYDDDAPANEEGLRAVMRQVGITSPEARRHARNLLQVNVGDGVTEQREFYAAAAKALRREPAKYGGKRQAASV